MKKFKILPGIIGYKDNQDNWGYRIEYLNEDNQWEYLGSEQTLTEAKEIVNERYAEMCMIEKGTVIIELP